MLSPDTWNATTNYTIFQWNTVTEQYHNCHYEKAFYDNSKDVWPSLSYNYFYCIWAEVDDFALGESSSVVVISDGPCAGQAADAESPIPTTNQNHLKNWHGNYMESLLGDSRFYLFNFLQLSPRISLNPLFWMPYYCENDKPFPEVPAVFK